jgi:spore germination cell wall hydrolase CwlJ-like protein
MVVSVLSLISFAHPAQAEEETELICLATNIYWEARNQSFAGQIAVGLVTINRVR